jgi:hypothetical protein
VVYVFRRIKVMQKKNKSERIFERYLNSNGYKGKWTHEPSISGKNKHPDYLLDSNGEKCFFEVKELRKKLHEPAEWPAYIEPYSSLRVEIDEARSQFKEFKKYPCSLVVYNIDDKQARLRPIYVFGAMLGNLGFVMRFDSTEGKAVKGTEKNVFLNGGKMLNKNQPQNTTISAIIVLEEFLDNGEVEKALNKEVKKQGRRFAIEELLDIRMKLYKNNRVRRVPRVIVIKNPCARMGFPDNLFGGPFDERWEMQDGKIVRVFTGNKLRELETLQENRKSFSLKTEVLS